MKFNKLCEIEDFADPELADAIRDTSSYKMAALTHDFPRGTEHRKDWEVAMAVRALRSHGALRPDATILGVAVGIEDTVFYLTRHVRQVFATDRYLFAEEWDAVAPMTMLVQPDSLAPYDFDPTRLVVQHMDGRSLRYPDDTFDGIFSSGSIEHFGELQDVAHAAYEMGRVLKPGGILSVSTEFKLAGPPGGIGWPGLTLVFSADNLQRYIVEASGLELVDDFDDVVSEATLATERGLVASKVDHDDRIARLGPAAASAEFAHWDFPHIVVAHEGYVFGSVHLALRKPLSYPATPNEWARPGEDVLRSIAEYNASAVADRVGASDNSAATGIAEEAEADRAGRPLQPDPPSWAGCMHRLEKGAAVLAARQGAVETRTEELASQAASVQGWIDRAHELSSWLGRGHSDILRHTMTQLASFNGHRDASEMSLLPGWSIADVVLSTELRYRIVVDAMAGDPIADAFAAGHGIVFANDDLVQLMLGMVSPGQWVIDLGAHVGTFSLAAAALGCKVLAVEASAHNAALLRASAAINGFNELHVIRAVATDHAGDVPFVSNGPWGRVTSEAEGAGGERVPAVTIDEVLYEFGWGRASFIKMDVEGSELQAIRGMRRLLSGPAAPPLLFESNGYTLRLAGLTPNDLARELEALGYTEYLVEPGRLIHVRPEQVQPQTEADLLALKKGSPCPTGWTVEPSMTSVERIRRFVTDCESGNPHVRAHIALVLAGEDADTIAQPSIATALARLEADPVDSVRAAASWWVPTGTTGRNGR